MNINYNFDNHFLWSWCSEESKKTLKVPNVFVDTFIKYYNKIERLKNIRGFIETGTYLGHTSILCSHLFETVDTIELYDLSNPYNGNSLKELYKEIQEQYLNVKIHIGQSSIVLADILNKNKNNPYVFLLDAHTENYTPLLEELMTIKTISTTNDHIIMIDDCNAIGGNYPTQKVVVDNLLKINKNYNIDYFNNNNTLIAY